MGNMIRYGGVNVTDRDPRYQQIMALLQAQGLQPAQKPNPLENSIQQPPQFSKPAMFGNAQTPAQQAVGYYPNNRFGTWHGAPSAGGFNSMGGAVWGGALPNKMPPIGQPQPSQAEVERMFQEEWAQQRNPQKPQGNPLSNDIQTPPRPTTRPAGFNPEAALGSEFSGGVKFPPNFDWSQMSQQAQRKPGFYPRIGQGQAGQKKNEFLSNVDFSQVKPLQSFSGGGGSTQSSQTFGKQARPQITQEEADRAWAQLTPQQRQQLSDNGVTPTTISVPPSNQRQPQRQSQQQNPQSGGMSQMSSILTDQAFKQALAPEAQAAVSVANEAGMSFVAAGAEVPAGYTGVATMADGTTAVVPNSVFQSGASNVIAESIPYIAAAYSAYSGYQNAQNAMGRENAGDEVMKGIQNIGLDIVTGGIGSTIRRGIEKFAPGVGKAIDDISMLGPRLLGLNKQLGKLVTGKSEDQAYRDVLRKEVFQKAGLADDKFQMKFKDGGTFDLGKDGKIYGKKGEGQIDYEKDGTIVAFADQLADQMKLEGKARSAFSFLATKAATSGTEDFNVKANRIKEIGAKLGLKTDFVTGGASTTPRQPVGPRKNKERRERAPREATPNVDDGQYPIMISKKPAPVVGNPFTPLKTKEDFINAIMGIR